MFLETVCCGFPLSGRTCHTINLTSEPSVPLYKDIVVFAVFLVFCPHYSSLSHPSLRFYRGRKVRGTTRAPRVHRQEEAETLHPNTFESSLRPTSLASMHSHDNGYAKWWWSFYWNSSTVMELITPIASLFIFGRLWILKYFFLNWPEIIPLVYLSIKVLALWYHMKQTIFA